MKNTLAKGKKLSQLNTSFFILKLIYYS